ncbi:hypothetical protein [Candidatus Methanodesulfokora washburnensis]|uniref:Membrane protein 6-pyruvoyl-tetrahydropterin synthase-related domain-containing protein n=1 Tax=Candidatus Methanodesulfokora washburnensis TaxID=2478471 RepID=A0A429GT84_9CREN|nr:hypothetical protein [Candidatus Methanodesulfokores washburnensis]RSN76943.1 hypothetical protein D6D85_03195 [Candidatus Methanodesulfokores washburnensis]
MFHKIRRSGSLIDVFIIAILSLIPVRSTLNGGLIEVQDFGFPLQITHPSTAFYGWCHRCLTGLNNMLLSFNWLPYHSLLFLLNSLLVPVWVLNRLVIIASFFFLGLGVYFLLRVCGRSRYASLVASLFAMFNPTVATRDSWGQMPLLIQLGFIPIVLGLYLWLKNKKFSNLSIAILTSIASLPIMILANPVEIGFLGFCLVVLMLVKIAYNPEEISNNIKILILYIMISFFINSWWLVPGLYFMLYSRGQFYTAEAYALMLQKGISEMSSVIKAFLMYPLETTSRFDLYSEPRIKLLGLLIILIASLSLFRKDKLNSFSLIVLSVAVALFQGISPPLGGFYRFLYKNFPGFFIYREVHHFDSLLLLSISLLLGSSLDTLAKKMASRISRILLTFLMLILVSFYGYPVLSGDLNGFFTPLNIPSYYIDALNYLEKVNITARVFYESGYLTIYSWHPPHCVTENVFYLDPFMPSIVNSRNAFAATTLPDYARSQISGIIDSFYDGNINALRFLGIKYVVIDSADSTSDSFPVEGLKLRKEIGSIKIYEVENSLPLIYPTNSLTVLKEDKRFAFLNAKNSSLFVLEGQSPFSKNVEFSSKVNISWTYVSPVEYRVKVNSTGPFFLVFLETYDDGWSASSSGRIYTHFIGYGYSNAWLINDSGCFEVKVEFRPHVFFYYGSAITIFSIIAVSLLVVLEIRQRNSKSEERSYNHL